MQKSPGTHRGVTHREGEAQSPQETAGNNRE